MANGELFTLVVITVIVHFTLVEGRLEGPLAITVLREDAGFRVGLGSRPDCVRTCGQIENMHTRYFLMGR